MYNYTCIGSTTFNVQVIASQRTSRSKDQALAFYLRFRDTQALSTGVFDIKKRGTALLHYNLVTLSQYPLFLLARTIMYLAYSLLYTTYFMSSDVWRHMRRTHYRSRGYDGTKMGDG